MDFLTWLEESRVGETIAESLYLYPLLLTFHTIGMAFVVGISVAIGLRVLGVAPGRTLSPLGRLMPFVWGFAGVSAITGLLLMVSRARRLFVDPVLYVKLLFVALGLIGMRTLQRRLFREGAHEQPKSLVLTNKMLAGASLFMWFMAIAIGKLVEYDFYRFWNNH